jgi:hypothetical protein
MSETRCDGTTVAHELGDLCLAELRDTGLDHGQCRMMPDCRGQAGSGADDDLYLMFPLEQLLHEQTSGCACGAQDER